MRRTLRGTQASQGLCSSVVRILALSCGGMPARVPRKLTRPAKDEAMPPTRRRPIFRTRRTIFSTTWTAAPVDPGRDQGAQYLARVDGRQRGLLGLAREQQLRHLRPAENAVLVSVLGVADTGTAAPRQKDPGRAAARLSPSIAQRRASSISGLMNEPGFTQADEPDEFGLCLDKPSRRPRTSTRRCTGARPACSGLRLYPNPNFDQAAREKWNNNKARFYTDPKYYSTTRSCAHTASGWGARSAT